LYTLQLNTVTYGISAAFFFAVCSLFQMAHLYESEFTLPAIVLRTDLYVDDLLKSRKKTEITKLLIKAGWTNTEFTINSSATLESSVSEIPMQLNKYYSTKMLGLSWQPSKDSFLFHNQLKFSENPNRRSVLSKAARVFIHLD